MARRPVSGARAARSARGLVALLVAASAACGSGEPPRLVVRDVGSETRDTRTRATFELRNEGGHPLAVDRVVPSCACGPVSRLPEELLPGSTARLDVECAGARLGGDDARELAIRTSDPRSPETLLRVRLGRAADALPATYLGYVAVGETLVRDVTLAPASADVVPRRSGDVEIEPVPPRADGTRAVRVRFRPSTPGVLRTVVDLGAAGRLPIAAVAYDGLLAVPPEVRLPRPSGASALPIVSLVAAGAEPFAIARIEYPPGLGGELRAIVPGRQYRLVLAARGPLSADGAMIRVHGARDDDPVVAIPVVDATRGAGPPA